MSAVLRPGGTAYPLVVGVVGAGRVGAVLGAALEAAGHRVVATAAVSEASRDRAARLLPRAAVLPADEVARAAKDLLLLAGAHGLDVLGDVRGMALHPAMTFTGEASDLDRLPGIAWGVTAEDRAFATRLVADLQGIPEWIAEDKRPVYHSALAHGANHLVTLVNEAADLLRAAGVERPEAVLSPLLHAALDNALRLGDAALTGPVSRGDAGTVRKHLRHLAPDAVPAYLALARRTADRAIAAGRLRPQDAAPLLDVLAQATVGSSS